MITITACGRWKWTHQWVCKRLILLLQGQMSIDTSRRPSFTISHRRRTQLPTAQNSQTACGYVAAVIAQDSQGTDRDGVLSPQPSYFNDQCRMQRQAPYSSDHGTL